MSKLCDTCIYRDNTEYMKPCVIYRDDCSLYQKEDNKMTREKAIEILQGAIKKPNTKDGYLGQAIDMAIKALEQEPKIDVLDKIMDEVCDIDDEIVLNPDSLFERKVYVRFNTVIDIIDKYKAESEEI